MDLRDILIHVYESADHASALRVLAQGGRRAVWMDAAGDPLAAWPQGSSVSPRLRDEALHASAPVVHPLGPAFPEDAAAHPGASALLLPLRNGAGGPPAGAVVLIGAVQPESEGGGWKALAAALGRVGEQARRVRALSSDVRVTLYDEMRALLTRSVCAWAGVPPVLFAIVLIALLSGIAHTLAPSHFLFSSAGVAPAGGPSGVADIGGLRLRKLRRRGHACGQRAMHAGSST